MSKIRKGEGGRLSHFLTTNDSVAERLEKTQIEIYSIILNSVRSRIPEGTQLCMIRKVRAVQGGKKNIRRAAPKNDSKRGLALPPCRSLTPLYLKEL